MPIYNGSKRIGTLSLGGKKIGEAYVGSTCVYRTEVVRTYEAPVITEFSYPTLGFREGATATPTIKFTQDWTDNFGNSGTLTEETTDYTAEYTAYSPGGEDIGFSFGENGEVIADSKNVSGTTNFLGSVTVTITAHGLTRGTSADVNQQSRPADIVDPEVNIDTTIFQEYASSGTKKVYFNYNRVSTGSAREITPEYFLDSAGNKYDVVAEALHHDNNTSGGLDTAYWVELPYGGSAANYVFYLWCEWTFSYEGWSDSACIDEVRATNILLINSSGDFYVRS